MPLWRRRPACVGPCSRRVAGKNSAPATRVTASFICPYFREYKGLFCLLGVVPAALYVANPWSVMVFVKFIGG